jgi:hypothetical protein
MSQRCLFMLPLSALLFHAIGLVKGSPESLCQFLSIVICPEVHKEDAGLLIEHMVVQGGHLYVVVAQGLNYRLHLILRHRKVTVYGSLTPSCWLKVQGS